MKAFRILGQSFAVFSENRLRASLTALGIAIGVSSVITMLAIGEGARSAILGNLQTLDPGILIAVPERGTLPFTEAETDSLIAALPAGVVVAPEAGGVALIAADDTSMPAVLSGATPALMDLRDLTLVEGRFLDQADIDDERDVIVLDTALADTLFPEKGNSTIGQSVTIAEDNFEIIGLTEPSSGTQASAPIAGAFVPISTYLAHADVDEIQSIMLRVPNDRSLEEVKATVNTSLASGADADSAARARILSQDDLVSALDQASNILTLFLTSIAGISLLIGGIGIMNMMFTNVTERTREIGLRKALGGTRSAILFQFLFESAFLSLAAGAVGVGIGALASRALFDVLPFAPEVTAQAIMLAFGISALVGIAFGFIPAYRAATVVPSDALRHE